MPLPAILNEVSGEDFSFLSAVKSIQIKAKWMNKEVQGSVPLKLNWIHVRKP